MEDQDRKIENITQAQIILTGIKLEMEAEEKIKRLAFETNKGTITWKPMVEKKVFQQGFEVFRRVQMSFEELPEKLQAWANILQKEGKMHIIANYTVMTVEKDGEEVSYRFITSEKTLNTWEVTTEKK